MPHRTIYLNADKSDFLVLQWGLNWKNLTIIYKGNEIGCIPNSKELKKGQSFTLDAERTISVQLAGSMFPELEVLLNGKYIRGSNSDPRELLKQIFFATLVLGLINIIAGILVSIYQFEFLQNLGLGLATIISGSILIGLGLWTKHGSILALYSLIAFLILDTTLTFIFSIQKDYNPTSGIVIKIFIIIYFFKGIKASRKLKEEQEMN